MLWLSVSLQTKSLVEDPVCVWPCSGILNGDVYEDMDGKITKSAGGSKPGKMAKAIDDRIHFQSDPNRLQCWMKQMSWSLSQADEKSDKCKGNFQKLRSWLRLGHVD